jgi:hypothetical protein
MAKLPHLALWPSLMGVPTPRQYPPEPSWMLQGWIELRSRARPGWVGFCETWWDVSEEIKCGPGWEGELSPIYWAIRRGPFIGDEFPVTERVQLCMGGRQLVRLAKAGEMHPGEPPPW